MGVVLLVVGHVAARTTSHPAGPAAAVPPRLPTGPRGSAARGHSRAVMTVRYRPVLLGAGALFFRRLTGDSRVDACTRSSVAAGSSSWHRQPGPAEALPGCGPRHHPDAGRGPTRLRADLSPQWAELSPGR